MKRAFSGRQALWGALSLASRKALDREKPKCQQEDICLARAHAARQRSIFLGQRRANPPKDQENESRGGNNKDRRERQNAKQKAGLGLPLKKEHEKIPSH